MTLKQLIFVLESLDNDLLVPNGAEVLRDLVLKVGHAPPGELLVPDNLGLRLYLALLLGDQIVELVLLALDHLELVHIECLLLLAS